MSGANKTRTGTPDTLIILENGKYILAEYTTEKKGVCEKFKKDLGKCFDEEKTGISITEIEKIVLCHNSTLTTEEENSLKEKCHKHRVELDIFDIDSISFDLYQNYPGIAKDFLGVEVDTGQIVDLDEFITTYNKRKFVAPLDTKFCFRENEIKEILQGLEENNLVIVSGKAGVGKSRLVLECCRKFLEKYSEYKVKCIFDKGVDIYEDIRVYLSDDGSYLIFLDDANRVKNFEYFIHLLFDKRENQQTKIIATVRDYAVEQIKEVARSYDNNLELVKIDSLTDKQIEQIVKEEYKIQNQLYIERIVDIAQGNPRLAIMTALVVEREKTIESISNVSDIYDIYYSSIRQDITDFRDRSLLEVAGIVAFFQVVDKSNDEMMERIQTAFKIDREIFWEAVRKLYEFELVDMYEDEIARISDQVLATYLFYLTFFKEKLWKFSVLLDNFFPQFQYNFVDALNPVLNAFDSGKIIKILSPDVDRVWKIYEEAKEEKSLIQLMKLFWFFKQTEILIYAKNCIDQMEVESVDISTLDIPSNSNIDIPPYSILDLLSLSSNFDEQNFQIAIDLLFEYLTKKPQELLQVFRLLIEVFGFEYDSYITKFISQSIVIDKLLEKVNQGKNKLFVKLFFGVAEKYLKLEFNTSKLKNKREFLLRQFPPLPTPELLNLRQKIWQGVFQLYQIDIFEKEVINIIHQYSKSYSNFPVGEIIKQDTLEVLDFIANQLNPKDYSHCLIVQKYLDFLESRQIEFNNELRERFVNETYELSRILLADRNKGKNLNLDWKEYDKFKQNQIKEYFANYDFKDYQDFFAKCHEIKAVTELKNNYDFQSPTYKVPEFPSHKVVEVFIFIACKKSELYLDVLKDYLKRADPFQINNFPFPLVQKLIEISGVEKAFELLNQFDFASKRKWLFGFYNLLPEDKITSDYLEKLYNLYRESKLSEMPQDFDFLLKYRHIDKNVVAQVTEIILSKINEEIDNFIPFKCLFNPFTKANQLSIELFNLFAKVTEIMVSKINEEINYSDIFTSLFNPYTKANQLLIQLFTEKLDVLKEIYFLSQKIPRYSSNFEDIFTRILAADQNFIIEYIDWVYDEERKFSNFQDDLNYTFLWQSENYQELITLVVEHIYQKEKELSNSGFSNTILERIFFLEVTEEEKVVFEDRQNQLLKSLIKNRYTDIDLMQLLFSVTTTFPYERRYQFIDLFCQNNQNFQDFKKLPLEPYVKNDKEISSEDYILSSSKNIEATHKIIEYLESLQPIFNTIDLLQHKEYVEKEIKYFKKWIEDEKKRNFIED
ncbi:ATP-binding protein [Okeania sp. SIO2B3]|uniref:nSTAND3 domain-containing NTPase n=1 Tax=Okeania sp. SIO2B3 TaxID=2607784 RepID=UPI0013BF5384|nr:ATP-binding protein [Okeania sp. SIO2B3]NET40800.1 ATP-binding protein [Okeania sp. SIO2B3]